MWISYIVAQNICSNLLAVVVINTEELLKPSDVWYSEI